MTTLATITAAILALQGHPRAHGAVEARARLLAATIAREAARFDVDPILVAAVIAKESGFRADARGAAGEAGLMQVLRGTLATRGYDHLTDAALMSPPINLRLGVRHLARVRKLCGGGPAVNWLSVYSGQHKCRPSPYSRVIVAAIKALQREAVAAK